MNTSSETSRVDEHAPGRVLVIGDDMRIFLAVCRALGRSGKQVHAAPFDWNSPALKSRHVTRIHRLPRYQDDPGLWLANLCTVLERERIDLVIPCDDRVILPLDYHRDELSGFRIAIPNRQAMDPLFDKERTKAMAISLGIPVAAGRELLAQDTAVAITEEFGLPVVIKPRRSYWLDRLQSWGRVHIPIDAVELQSVLESIDDRSRYMIEAYFDGGDGVGVSVLSSGGTILQAFQHRRMREGWGGSSSYRISEAVDPALLDACTRVCQHTALTGVCMFEFRRGRNGGGWILIETNARFWGSCGLPTALGVDFPNRLFDLMVHGLVHEPIEYPKGIRSRNIVLDALNIARAAGRVRDAHAFLTSLGEVGDFLLQPWRWARGTETSDSLVADDLSPGFAEIRRTLVGMASRGERVRSGRRLSETSAPARDLASEVQAK